MTNWRTSQMTSSLPSLSGSSVPTAPNRSSYPSLGLSVSQPRSYPLVVPFFVGWLISAPQHHTSMTKSLSVKALVWTFSGGRLLHPHWSGHSFFLLPDWTLDPDLELYTDSSGTIFEGILSKRGSTEPPLDPPLGSTLFSTLIAARTHSRTCRDMT